MSTKKTLHYSGFLLAIILIGLPLETLAGEIALTFDDAPTGDSGLFSGTERTQAIISALKEAHVRDVMFFCNTARLDNSGHSRLQSYTAAGFHLGNHSHSHRSANDIGVANYLQDMSAAHEILRTMKGFLPYHRFPYLHHGKSETEIHSLQIGLDKLGYVNGYVTVDNFDFYLNHLLKEAHKNGIRVDMQAAEDLYVETLWLAIEFYDQLALKYLKRSPKHVLLLHENDVAALFLPALIRKIRDEGWTIVSPQLAYTDPIATTFPKTTFMKQGRVAALAMDAGATTEELRHSRENEGVLTELFSSRVIISDEKP